MSTVIVETPDENESASDSGTIAAAEANAHIAEVAEESAEEAAAISHGAASVSIDAATAAADEASVAVHGATVAEEAAHEAVQAKQDIHSMFADFKSEVLAAVAGLQRANATTDSDAGSNAPLLDIEIAPQVEPDNAPTEQHPYYRKWSKKS